MPELGQLKVEIKLEAMIHRITRNRDRHRAAFEKAMAAYRVAAAEELNGMIDALEAGKTPRLHVSLPIPEDHTKEYNAVLDMLEQHDQRTLVITQSDFRRYMRDEWDWKERWLGTVSNYVVDYTEVDS